VVDHNDALLPWDKAGNRLADSLHVCRWVEQAGVDAVHVSTGSFFRIRATLRATSPSEAVHTVTTP
jgi:hypothetical protein